MRSLFLVSTLLISATAYAHVEVESGAATANASSKITFAIAHGCTPTGSTVKVDTVSVRIDIPTGVTGVRALPSDFGKPTTIATDGSGNVTSITWTKAAGDVADADLQWYELTLRARMPNAPFTQLQFNVTQTCNDSQGAPIVVPWDQPPGSTTGSPAPQVKLVPAHRSGWNKFTLTGAIAMTDLPVYFGDAQIVWKGNAAYSPSGDVAGLIAATPGVTALAAALASGDEIWVKY